MSDEIDELNELRSSFTRVEIELNKLSENFLASEQKLEHELSKLKITNDLLESLSQKIAQHTKDLGPAIIDLLKVLNSHNIEKSNNLSPELLQEQSDILLKIEEKIRERERSLNKFGSTQVKFMLGVVLCSVVSVLTSIYAASYMIKSFPTRVVIDKPGTIILHDSEVSLWGTDSSKILKQSSKKGMLNNKN